MTHLFMSVTKYRILTLLYNNKTEIADLSAGVEGGPLLPSSVVLPPLVLSLRLYLEGLIGLTLNDN